MINQSITLNQTIDSLNDLLKIDPICIQNLCNTRVECNSNDLINHPTVQVNAQNQVGLLGILNSLFGANEEGYGAIAALYDDDNHLIKFINLLDYKENE